MYGLPFVEHILQIFTDAPLKEKSVLLVGGEGPLRLTLQCLIEKGGTVADTSHWNSKSLQKQVCVNCIKSFLII